MMNIVERIRALEPTASIAPEIERLRAMRVSELRECFEALFGRSTASRNKDYLYKRVAYRMQEVREGRTLSEAARAMARELAADREPRVRPPTGALAGVPPRVEPAARDPRLPPVGTVLRRELKGVAHHVKVLETGFEYEGKRYASLSEVARLISGTRYNGFAFFKLGTREART